jgi:predicted nucleic acid-binding protein
MHNLSLPDTSCLILFRKMHRLDLLYKVYGNLLTTPEVANEYKNKLPDWVKVQPIKDRKRFKYYSKLVDVGEASIIALATEVISPILIIDDKRGRKLATALNLQLTGTLGTVLKAKRQGVISEVKPVLNDLKSIHFRISSQLEKLILEEAGE